MALVLALSAATAAASSPDELDFLEAAETYRRQVGRCWAVPTPSAERTAELAAACWIWAGRRWAQEQAHMAAVLYQLQWTEGENPRDPSFGQWGVTILAARMVERRHSWPGLVFPKRDRDLAEKLSRDDFFNCGVASGALSFCWALYPPNHELRAVVCYKLGALGGFTNRRAERRKRHYQNVRGSFQCVRRKLAAGATRYCECMSEDGRERMAEEGREF